MYDRVMALIVKEVLTVLRDRRLRFMLVILPVIQLFIFALAATLDVRNVSLGILNRDSGEQSIELIQRFIGSPTFKHITYLSSIDEITPFIDHGKGIIVLSIDEQFSRNLNQLKPSDVQLILDGRRSNTSQIVGGYATQIIQQFSNDFAAKQGVKLQTTQLVIRNWFNPNLLYYWYNVPSLAGVLTLNLGMLITSLSIAREREMGTFDQLLVSPLKPIEILMGKIIPAIIIGVAEGSIIILAGIFVFRVPFAGDIFLLYFSLLVFVSSIVGVGLFISSISSTQQQAMLGTFVFVSPSISLSGFATPIENMPEWLQYMTYANPLRYMLVISKGIFLKALPIDIVLSNTWPMAVIALFTLSGATWFFRSRLQ